MDEQDGDCFDDRRCPEALFVATLVHDHGQEGQVRVAGEVGLLDGVRLENGGAEETDCE